MTFLWNAPISHKASLKEDKKNMRGAKNIQPMLLKLGSIDDIKRTEYIFEPKLDGIRALCHIDGSMKFITRNAIDITHNYPEFVFRKNIKAKTAILDGEIVMLDVKGNPSFNLLQTRKSPHLRTSRGHKEHATFIVFDILMKDGVSLLEIPLSERKKMLEKIVVPQADLLEIIASTHDGKKLWSIIIKRKLEGMIAKKEDSLYYPGIRTPEWLKIKITQAAGCVIIGFTQEKRAISALLLGVYNKGALQYIGKVGTGFNEANIKTIYAKLSKIVRQTAPCPCPIKNAVWVSPKQVCEVKYMEWTRDKKLRAPVFVRLRSDKKPKECTLDQ